jgi:hypothetical protein
LPEGIVFISCQNVIEELTRLVPRAWDTVANKSRNVRVGMECDEELDVALLEWSEA